MKLVKVTLLAGHAGVVIYREDGVEIRNDVLVYPAYGHFADFLAEWLQGLGVKEFTLQIMDANGQEKSVPDKRPIFRHGEWSVNHMAVWPDAVFGH